MSKTSNRLFQRHQGATLLARLKEPRRFLQVVAGPRQVGKTTLVEQVLRKLTCPSLFVSADEPTLKDIAWLVTQWERARFMAREAGRGQAVLALDEIQKIPGWSEEVKRLWDEDTRAKLKLHVIILGSAPLLVERGLGESLSGRFEVLRLTHWSFAEMKSAFGFSLEQFLYFGGYPGAAPLVSDPMRWRRYILDSLIETTISRDVLLLTRVDKPVLLRRLFELGCQYSGQVLSYTKMLGQLHDAGNTTTLAHYLDLLAGAGLIVGISKFSTVPVRSRASSPKLQVLNTALMSAQMRVTQAEAKADGKTWGRLVESAVGAHLVNIAHNQDMELFYWRERNREVDFVLRKGRKLFAIEVKSGLPKEMPSGLLAFSQSFGTKKTLLVGSGGIPVEEFLLHSAIEWLD
jgi:predicted AAA+ superfamily ATPase